MTARQLLFLSLMLEPPGELGLQGKGREGGREWEKKGGRRGREGGRVAGRKEK